MTPESKSGHAVGRFSFSWAKSIGFSVDRIFKNCIIKTFKASTRGFVCILGKREGKIPSGKNFLKEGPVLFIVHKGVEYQPLEEGVSVFFVDDVFGSAECLSMELCLPQSWGDGDRHYRSYLFHKPLSSKFSSAPTLSVWFLWRVLAGLHMAHEYVNIPSGLQTVQGRWAFLA